MRNAVVAMLGAEGVRRRQERRTGGAIEELRRGSCAPSEGSRAPAATGRRCTSMSTFSMRSAKLRNLNERGRALGGARRLGPSPSSSLSLSAAGAYGRGTVIAPTSASSMSGSFVRLVSCRV